MAGGIAVRGNLLCVTWTAARGHVFLFDLEAQQRVSSWTLPPGSSGYSDAAGVAMDDRYHLFVADPQNDRVREFNPFGRHLQDFGGAPPAVGDVARDRIGVLDRPHAVAWRGDVLHVACGDQPRRRGVQRFTRQGTVLKPLCSRGDAEAEFGAPRGIWADADGVLVADTLRGVLQQFRGDGTFLRELPCASPGRVARPIAVLRQPYGRCLYVDRGDDPGVRAIGADGALQPVHGDVAAHCREVLGLAADRAGRIHVLDHLGERVVRFSPDLQFEQVVIDLAELLDDPPHHSGTE
jgi:hypothetical protein